MLLFFCCDQTPEKENKETVMYVGSWHYREGQNLRYDGGRGYSLCWQECKAAANQE